VCFVWLGNRLLSHAFQLSPRQGELSQEGLTLRLSARQTGRRTFLKI